MGLRQATIPATIALIALIALTVGATTTALAASQTQPSSIGPLGVNDQAENPNATIDYSGSTLTLEAQADQTVSGETDLSQGQNVTVRLRSSGSSPFLKSQTATVAEDGTFQASFDLSDVEPPANATASVYADGEQVAGPVEVDIVAERSPTDQSPIDNKNSSPGQPGFGLILAVIAVIAGAGLIKHRN